MSSSGIQLELAAMLRHQAGEKEQMALILEKVAGKAHEPDGDSYPRSSRASGDRRGPKQVMEAAQLAGGRKKKKHRAPAVDVSRPKEHPRKVGIAPPATSKKETMQLPIAKSAIRHFVGARGWKVHQLRRDVGKKVKLQVSDADAVQGVVEVSCHSDFFSQAVAKVKHAIAKAE